MKPLRRASRHSPLNDNRNIATFIQERAISRVVDQKEQLPLNKHDRVLSMPDLPAPRGAILVAGDVTIDEFIWADEPDSQYEFAPAEMRRLHQSAFGGGAWGIYTLANSVAKNLDHAFAVVFERPSMPQGTLSGSVSETEFLRALEPFAHRFRSRLSRYDSRAEDWSQSGSQLAWRISERLGQVLPEKETPNKVVANIKLDGTLAHLPTVAIINDTNLGFGSRAPFPLLERKGDVNWIICRLMGSLTTGTSLGNILPERADETILVINIESVRSADVHVSLNVSWEQTIEDLVFEFGRNKGLRDLLRAAHVLVTLDHAGLLHIWKDEDTNASQGSPLKGHGIALYYSDGKSDATKDPSKVGQMMGCTTCLTVSLATHLLNNLMATGKTSQRPKTQSTTPSQLASKPWRVCFQ